MTKPSVIVFILTLLSSAAALAGSGCDLSFEFLGFVTESDSAFIIGTSNTYMCLDEHVIRIVVQSDSATKVEDLVIDKGAWKDVARFIETLQHEEPVVFSDSLDDWIEMESDLKMRLGEPTEDQQARFASWKKRGLNAWYWNDEQGSAGVVMPEVAGGSLRLLSFYIHGLYYDYRFEQVFYFPRSGYLFIITHNDRYSGEFDSENGYLLLRRL